MDLHVTEQDGVAVYTPSGDALGGPEGSALHDRIQTDRQAGGTAHAAVDLAAVRHMNSSGLGMLVGAMTSARTAGGDVRLAAVPERVATLLRLTRLDAVFQSFPTVEAAVASFQR